MILVNGRLVTFAELRGPGAPSPEDVEAAREAAAWALHGLPRAQREALRDDLAQELAIKLWAGATPGALKRTARNWLCNRVRDEATQRETEVEASAGARPGGGRRAAEWKPTWYPPVSPSRRPLTPASASDWPRPVAPAEYAPLACEGARLMHVGSGQGGTRNVMEDALIALADSK